MLPLKPSLFPRITSKFQFLITKYRMMLNSGSTPELRKLKKPKKKKRIGKDKTAPSAKMSSSKINEFKIDFWVF